MLRFTTPDLLIVDDLRLRPSRDDEPVDLTLIAGSVWPILGQRFRARGRDAGCMRRSAA